MMKGCIYKYFLCFFESSFVSHIFRKPENSYKYELNSYDVKPIIGMKRGNNHFNNKPS